MKKFATVLFALALLASCGNNASTSKNEARTAGSAVSASPIILDGGTEVLHLSFRDSLLVAKTIQEPFYHVYDPATGKEIKSFGRAGCSYDGFYDGPLADLNIRNGCIQSYDFKSRSYVSLDIATGDVDRMPVPYELDFRPIRIAEADGNYYCVGALETGRIGTFDKDGDYRMFEYDFPFSTAPLKGIMRGGRFGSHIYLAPGISKFVILSDASDCFEIYDVENGKLTRTFVNEFMYPPMINVLGNSKTFLNHELSVGGFMRCYVNDERIYFLYSEESYGDALKKDFISDTVFEYDWNGGLVRAFKLPQPVGAFCVSGNVLFGARKFENHCEIVRYTI